MQNKIPPGINVVIMAELDWGGLHCQSHVMARGFAERGHKVFYINRTLQSWPRLRHLLVRLKPSPSKGINVNVAVPENITVLNLWVGPPLKWLRAINKLLIKFQTSRYDLNKSILITYIPTYNLLDLAKVIQPKILAYVCYHNFDADKVVADLLTSEWKLIETADILFADSVFLVKRLHGISGGKTVNQAPPGVYFSKFKKAFRGDEWLNPKKICFFGGAGPHLDIKTYNRLAEVYEVVFIAVIDSSIKNILSSKIKVIDPVTNDALPVLLQSMDVLAMLYLPSDYIDGVLPAKFFECIATGKPVLVSGLKESVVYKDYVYDTLNLPDNALDIVNNLSFNHTKEKSEKQFEVGESSDFGKRFIKFYDTIYNFYSHKKF